MAETNMGVVLSQLSVWQRSVMFVMGAIAFSVPILDHVINEVFRGHAGELTILHIVGDGVFLFAGVLAMVPQLAIRLADRLAVWRK